MKLHVVYDGQGDIVSMNTPMPGSASSPSPQFGVALQKGQFADDIEVPADYARLNLVELAQRVRVNIAADPRTFVARNG